MKTEYLLNLKIWLNYVLTQIKIYYNSINKFVLQNKTILFYSVIFFIGITILLIIIRFLIFKRKHSSDTHETAVASLSPQKQEISVSIPTPATEEEFPTESIPESIPEHMFIEEKEFTKEILDLPDAPIETDPRPISVDSFIDHLKSDLESEFIHYVKTHFPLKINFKEIYSMDDEIIAKAHSYIEKLVVLENNNYPFQKDYYHAKSIFYFIIKDLNNLKINIEKAIQHHPQEDIFYIELANLLLYQNEIKSAEEYLQKAHTLNPSNLEPYFLLGKIYFKKNNFTEALNLFNKIILLEPNNTMAHAYKGYILASKGYISDGERELKKAIALDYKNFLPYYLLGNIYKNVNQFDKSIGLYKKAIKYGCHSLELIENLAYCYYSLKKYNSVVSYLNDSFQKNLISAKASEILADSYEQLGQTKKTLSIYQQMSKTNTEKRYILKLADLYYQNNDYENSIATYLKALDPPHEKEIYLQISKIYFHHLKNDNEAEKYYLLILEKDKNNYEALSNLLLVAFSKNNFENCITYFEQIVKHPDYKLRPEILFKVGISYFKLKKYEECIMPLTKAEALGYVDEELYRSLAYSYFKTDKVNRAIDEYKKSIAVNAFNPANYNNLGVIFAQQEKYNEAIKQFKQALQVEKDNKEALYNLYKAYKILSQSESEKYLTQLNEIV